MTWPTCRVVRPSMALRRCVVFWATWGGHPDLPAPGWMKTVAGGRKPRYIGLRRNRAWFLMTGAVYNLIRIAALDAQAA